MAYVGQEEQREFVDKEFTSQDLDEMQELLADPSVDVQDRKNFLYALKNAGRLDGQELLDYAREVGADPVDLMKGGNAVHENMDHARNSLNGKRFLERLKNAGDVQRAQENLNGGGFSTSDEIIDEAEPALKLFDEFYPRYQEASGLIESAPMPAEAQSYDVVTVDTSSIGGSGGSAVASAGATYSHSGIDPKSIRDGLDEFRGIDFGAFHADADMLRKAHSSVRDGMDALERAWGSNTSDWTGDAKAAAEQVNNNLVKGSGDLSQALKTAPDNLGAGVDAVQQNVVNFVHRVLEVYGSGTVAELSPHQVDDLINAAKELPGVIADLHAKIEEIESKGFWDHFVEFFSNPLKWGFSAINPIASIIGYIVTEEITEDNIREETQKMESALAEVKTKLGEFCADYQQKASSIHSHAAEFVAGIDAAYMETMQLLGEGLEPDPFADPGGGKDGLGDTEGISGSIGAGGGVGAGGGIGAGGGGGISTGGGGGVPIGGGAGIDLPGDEAAGTNPVTGEPLEVDPETGDPYPIDPETGEPIKNVDDLEKLTVEHGDNTLTLTEPTEDGEMAITIDDGSGEPSEYQLDFSEEDGEAEGAEESRREETEFGPQGSDAVTEKVYRPGPDGKIHIEDGDLKIVAEQPEGPDGPTVVTVDNGDGEPVTYTLGETEGQEAGPRGLGPQPSATESAPTSRQAGQSAPDAGVVGGEGGGAPGPSADASAPTGGEAFAASSSPEFHGSSEGTVDPGIDVSADNTVNESMESSGDSSSSSTTHPQAVSGGSGGTAFGGGGGGSDLGSFSDSESRGQSTPSGANLGTAPGGDIPAGMSQGGGAGSSSASGMGMMGGMGAMGGGAGGGQGGDQERTSSAYRVEGNIFETFSNTVRISGTIGDNTADVPVRFTR